MEIQENSEGDCVNTNVELLTPLRLKRKAQVEKSAEEIPKLTDCERLALFGGNKDLLDYYSSIRELTENAEQNGEQCFCDPRDLSMVKRLKQEGWRPKVSLKVVKDEGEETDFGLPGKQTALDEADEEDGDCESEDSDKWKKLTQSEAGKENDARSFVCGVQGCSAQFTSLASHESHYHTTHNFVCHVCRRVFVSNFLLDIHLEENHDSYFQVLSPRVDMYRCLVESCAAKFRTAELRKDHLVIIHKFPAPFSFHGPINQRIRKPKSSKKKGRENNPKDSDKNEMETSDFNLDSKVSPRTTNLELPDSHAPAPVSLSPEMEKEWKTNSSEIETGGAATENCRRKGSNKKNRSKRRPRNKEGRLSEMDVVETDSLLTENGVYNCREQESASEKVLGSRLSNKGGRLSEMEVDFTTIRVEDGDTGSNVSNSGCQQQSSRGDVLARQGKNSRGRVPSTVCFGRGSHRAFQHRGGGRGRHWHQTLAMDVDTTTDIEKIDFTDLVESLES